MALSAHRTIVRGRGWRPDVVTRLGLDGVREAQLLAFCERWKVDDLELFGSVVRADFRTDSDVDVLVTFEPGADWGLIEHALMEELAGLLGRPVDLLTRRAVERSANMMRRASILEQAVSLLSTAKPSADAERVGT